MLLTIVFGLFKWPYAWPDISHWQAPIIQVNQVFKQSREASSILTYFSTSFEKQHQMRINWPQASQRGYDQSETLHIYIFTYLIPHEMSDEIYDRQFLLKRCATF